MKNVNEDISGHRPLKIDVINLLSFVMIQVPYITIKTIYLICPHVKSIVTFSYWTHPFI